MFGFITSARAKKPGFLDKFCISEEILEKKPGYGLLGVLLEAKQKKLIPEIKPILDALIDHQNFRISDRLYRRVLEVAGE